MYTNTDIAATQETSATCGSRTYERPYIAVCNIYQHRYTSEETYRNTDLLATPTHAVQQHVDVEPVLESVSTHAWQYENTHIQATDTSNATYSSMSTSSFCWRNVPMFLAISSRHRSTPSTNSTLRCGAQRQYVYFCTSQHTSA